MLDIPTLFRPLLVIDKRSNFTLEHIETQQVRRLTEVGTDIIHFERLSLMTSSPITENSLLLHQFAGRSDWGLIRYCNSIKVSKAFKHIEYLYLNLKLYIDIITG